MVKGDLDQARHSRGGQNREDEEHGREKVVQRPLVAFQRIGENEYRGENREGKNNKTDRVGPLFFPEPIKTPQGQSENKKGKDGAELVVGVEPEALEITDEGFNPPFLADILVTLADDGAPKPVKIAGIPPIHDGRADRPKGQVKIRTDADYAKGKEPQEMGRAKNTD